ncbi:DUF4089 domain-containing protein [Phreatobacter sp.]|uniref:DUF4089 domain-containing protein n=1 Tax=Phreatobacter sp. TaxID=1966341 RepID=UPI003F713507
MRQQDLTADEAGRIIDAVAPLVGLEVAPDYRPGVVLNLTIAARMARIVARVPHGDHADQAPVFEA